MGRVWRKQMSPPAAVAAAAATEESGLHFFGDGRARAASSDYVQDSAPSARPLARPNTPID